MPVLIKRIYEPLSPADGYRILVDRLWPRGVSKEAARLDLWLKEVAPSNTLRKWFNHEAPKWTTFSQRYHEELINNEAFKTLRLLAEQQSTITLLTATVNKNYNHALCLREWIHPDPSSNLNR